MSTKIKAIKYTNDYTMSQFPWYTATLRKWPKFWSWFHQQKQISWVFMPHNCMKTYQAPTTYLFIYSFIYLFIHLFIYLTRFTGINREKNTREEYVV